MGAMTVRVLSVIVLVSAVLATNASAATLTSPAGTPYEGVIHAESSKIEMHGEAFSFKCKSTLVAEMESNGSSIKGAITSLSFSECLVAGESRAVTVLKTGSLEVQPTGKGNATVRWSGGEITVHGPFGIQCVFTTSETHIGTLTGSATTGGTATLEVGAARVPRTGDSKFCGEYGDLTGSYQVTSPDYLGVDSSSPLTSPAGSFFEGSLHAESEGGIALHAEVATFTCGKSTLAAEIESLGSATTAAGKISSLTFNECNYPVTVFKEGTLEIHSGGKGNGTVTWTGGEITVHGPFGVYCLYTTNATDIGTLTGSTTTGATATLDLAGAKIPRTGDSKFCGDIAELTGSYKVTTPDYLGVHGNSPLTSPAGTPYEGTLHAESEGFEMHGEAFSFSCKSTIAVEAESLGSATKVAAKVSSLSFSECTAPVTVKALGSLDMESAGKGNGTVRWSGGEFTVDGPFGINCLYKTSNTDIGTLTGSTTTGATATLDLNASLIPRTGDSAFCGEFGELTGSYRFTSPDYLGVD